MPTVNGGASCADVGQHELDEHGGHTAGVEDLMNETQSQAAVDMHKAGRLQTQNAQSAVLSFRATLAMRCSTALGSSKECQHVRNVVVK